MAALVWIHRNVLHGKMLTRDLLSHTRSPRPTIPTPHPRRYPVSCSRRKLCVPLAQELRYYAQDEKTKDTCP